MSEIAVATAMGYEGTGMVITDKQGDVTIEPMLRFEFTRGEVGTVDEWVQTVQTTKVTNKTGDYPRGAISKQRACVEYSTTDPKYTCYDYELYDTTFFLRVQRETLEEPSLESAMGASITSPELAAAAFKDEMGPEVICYQQYGLRRGDAGSVTITTEYVSGCDDVKVSLGDGDLSFEDDVWSARVTYKMRLFEEGDERDDSVNPVKLMTEDMADLYAYTSYYDPTIGTFQTEKGTVALAADEEPEEPEPKPDEAAGALGATLAGVALAAASLAF